MFKLARPFFLICETPLHAGSGGELGFVDLPIQRERHTDFPKIEGSSLKGGLREAFEDPRLGHDPLIRVGMNGVRAVRCTDEERKTSEVCELYRKTIDLVFGPENQGDNNHAGALGFTDARLLLFPVKSMKGVFAWITCPQVIEKFKNDLALCTGITPDFAIPNAVSAPHECDLLLNNTVILEEYSFPVNKDADVNGACSKFATWVAANIFPTMGQPDVYAFWRNKVQRDIVVLTNDDFRDFVNLSTEVITRIKINNETGTVQPGALFTEEYLPSESVLYSLALATPIFKKEDTDKGIFNQSDYANRQEELVMQFFANGLPEVIQLGGNATIGKGLMRVSKQLLQISNTQGGQQ